MNKKAFTLTELLIVLAVIFVLVSILVPAMGRAREGARRLQCVNNLRQHGIAWYLYLADNREIFPAFSGSLAVLYQDSDSEHGLRLLQHQ